MSAEDQGAPLGVRCAWHLRVRHPDVGAARSRLGRRDGAGSGGTVDADIGVLNLILRVGNSVEGFFGTKTTFKLLLIDGSLSETRANLAKQKAELVSLKARAQVCDAQPSREQDPSEGDVVLVDGQLHLDLTRDPSAPETIDLTLRNHITHQRLCVRLRVAGWCDDIDRAALPVRARSLHPRAAG